MNRQRSMTAGTQATVEDKSQCDPSQRAVVLGQLARIQKSHAFGNSARAKEFLSYVVEHAVDGHTELLKERSIGVDLFDRAPSYMTGEDPIVRVNAAEVRKRLALYYAEEESTPAVRIEIPVGSYIPIFHWGPSEYSVAAQPSPPAPAEPPPTTRNEPRTRLRIWGTVMAAILLVVLGVALAFTLRRHLQQRSGLEDFWAPVLKNGQPVLICLPSPVSYTFDGNLYKQAIRAHPSLDELGAQQNIVPLQLDPGTSLKWKDVIPLTDFYVNKDDAYVAADLSDLFGRFHKSNQVRIGRDFTYEDLRNSPAVLIGAFNNPWSIRMAAEMPIYFQGRDGTIVERGDQGRVWRTVDDNRSTQDFAIVARLLNFKTGQFLVILGGLGMVGTQATGKLVSSQGDLEAALRTAPAGWQGKNLEMVIESDIIDGSASPPHVLVVKTW